MKKNDKKKVKRHLKDDIKMFKHEAKEDKDLMAALDKKKASSRKKVSKKKPGHAKFEKVLKEYKKGTLHIGSKKGPKVRKKSQALAIAFSEDRKADHTNKGVKKKHKKRRVNRKK